MADRDASGRFVKGHKSSGGRRSREGERKMLARFKAAVSEQDLINITAALVTRAQTDNAAAKLLFSYLFGLPRQSVELDTIQAIRVEYVNDWR